MNADDLVALHRLTEWLGMSATMPPPAGEAPAPHPSVPLIAQDELRAELIDTTASQAVSVLFSYYMDYYCSLLSAAPPPALLAHTIVSMRALLPSDDARALFDSESGNWSACAALYKCITEAYTRDGPTCIDGGPLDRVSRDEARNTEWVRACNTLRIFQIFEWHGVFVPTSGQIRPLHWDLAREARDEHALVTFLCAVACTAPSAIEPPPEAGAYHLTVHSLLLDRLSHTPLLILDNRCELAATGLLNPVCDGYAMAQFWPTDAKTACGSRSYWRAQLERHKSTAPLPLCVVRRAHFWTILDLLSLLLEAYTVLPAGCRILIDCDIAVRSPVVSALSRASARALDQTHGRVTLLATPDTTLLRAWDQEAGRRALCERVAQRVARNESIAPEFLAEMQRSSSPSSSSLQSWSPDRAPPTRALRFSSMHQLCAMRERLPLCESIYVPTGFVTHFDDVYRLWRSTQAAVLLEARNPAELFGLFV